MGVYRKEEMKQVIKQLPKEMQKTPDSKKGRDSVEELLALWRGLDDSEVYQRSQALVYWDGLVNDTESQFNIVNQLVSKGALRKEGVGEKRVNRWLFDLLENSHIISNAGWKDPAIFRLPSKDYLELKGKRWKEGR